MADQGIEIEIYKDNAPFDLVDIINGRMAPTMLNEIRNHGAGSFQVSKSDKKILANPDLIEYRNLVRVRVAGDVIGGFIIQNKKTVIVGEGEAKDEVWEISGEGFRAGAKDAQVRPAGGVKATSKESRFFNFSTEQGTWYNSSEWVTPQNIWKWNEAGSWWGTGPADWPDAPGAYWIGALGRGVYDHPIATQYFRHEFTAAAAGAYSFFFSADDMADVFVDGEQLFTSSNTWQQTNRIDFDLTAGAHVIGVAVTNSPIGRGPSSLIGALFRVGDPLVPSSAQLLNTTSSSSWKVSPFPSEAPGWRPGDVLIQLINEAKARGVRWAQNVVPTFTAALDSAGEPWEKMAWEFPLGANLSEVIEQMEELACDIYLDPASYQLFAWKTRGVDRSIEGPVPQSGPDNPIVLRPGQNLLSADESGQADITNSLLLKTADGWQVATSQNADAIAKYGTVEGQISTDLSGAAAAKLTSELFKKKETPTKSATFVIFPVPGAVPMEDFNVGDYVSAPGDDGKLARRRVMSISVSENDSTGEPVWAVEFDNILTDRQTELEKFVGRATGGGSMAGGFANTSGTPSTVVVGVPPVTPVASVPDAPTGLTVESEGRWDTNGTARSDVYIYWNPVISGGNGAGPVTDIIGYELWGKPSTTTEPTLIGTYTDVEARLTNYTPDDEWSFQVRAISRTGGPSGFSDPVSHVMEAPTEPLQQPSKPTLESDLGVVVIKWDGLLGGEPAPAHHKLMRVERSSGAPTWNEQRRNLALNPVYGLGGSGWSSHTLLSSVSGINPPPGIPGCYAAQRTGTGSTAIYSHRGAGNRLTLTAGKTYTVSIWAYTSIDSSVTMRVGSGDGNTTSGREVTAALEAGVWTRLSLTFTAPSGEYNVSLLWAAGAVGDVIAMTGVLLEETNELRPFFFAGTAPENGDTRYSWSGTPYSSFSIQETINVTWTPVTTFTRVSGQDATGVVGQTYYYRLIAEDYRGEQSAPSPSEQITVKGVQPGQIAVGAVVAENIANNAITGIKIAANAIAQTHISPGAVGQQEIADFALTAKKFNTNRHLIF